ncbi:hypothetical protein C8J56DRAFT_799792 [Mycena floridula]|nr:hypothetical protein C8J56DRAFT_799792 [Mycena floridula]
MDNAPTRQNKPRSLPLHILHQNCRKSDIVQRTLLNTNANPALYDLICITEPFLYTSNPELTLATDKWHVLYPSLPHNSNIPKTRIRLLILVNKELRSDLVKQIAIPSYDCTAALLTISDNEKHLLFNIYNEPNTDITYLMLSQHF